MHRRLRGQLKLKSSTWHVDETFVRIARRWLYQFRAVDSRGQTVDFYLSETRDREVAKCFLKKAMENPDNLPPRVFARDGLRSYPAAIRDLQGKGRFAPPLSAPNQTLRQQSNRVGPSIDQAAAESDRGPRTIPTARTLIQSLEAVHMIRKRQVLGITRKNLHGQAWVFGALLGVR